MKCNFLSFPRYTWGAQAGWDPAKGNIMRSMTEPYLLEIIGGKSIYILLDSRHYPKGTSAGMTTQHRINLLKD